MVIGATVTGGGDVFSTPFDAVMPGVEVISTAIAHLMTGDGILRNASTRLLDAVLAVTLTLLLVGLLAWRRSAIGLLSIAGVLVVWLAGNFVAFSHGIWLSAALPVAAAAPPAILFGAVQLWLNRQQAQYFAMRNELLQQFQAPALRKWLTRNPEFLLEPVHQNAAIIFIDLSGFTALSETLGLDGGLALLKDFHTLVDAEVVAHGAIITSFLGDGAMILFGLPESREDDAGRAARCAIELCQPGRAMDRIAAARHRIANRLQGRRPFRPRRRLPPRRQLSARHRDRRQRQRGQPVMEVAATQGAVLALHRRSLRHAGTPMRPFDAACSPAPGNPDPRRSRALSVWLWRP